MLRFSRVGVKGRGFTLIELMITVAVVAVLAGIALPGYQTYMQRARRNDAREALQRAAQWLERVASIQGLYPAASGYPGALTLSSAGHYSIRYAPAADQAAYTLTATRRSPGAQANDPCGDFVVDQAGQRSLLNQATGRSVTDCWQR